MEWKERKIRLRSLNSMITCKLCKGYLIDATAITECLCTFCKSCLVKHLEENDTCPSCGIVIHQSYPLNYLRLDRTLQNIVYYLVPDLLNKEIKREKNFYAQRGLPYPKAKDLEKEDKGHTPRLATSRIIQPRQDDQIGLTLCPISNDLLASTNKWFLRCSKSITMATIKKFVSKKLFETEERSNEIDLLYNNNIIGRDHMLIFVLVTNISNYREVKMIEFNYRLSRKF